MKILHLCLGNYFVDNYSYQENMLTKYHSKMGYDVVVIAKIYSFDENGLVITNGEAKTYFNSDGVKIIRLAYKRPIIYGKFIKKFQGLRSELEAEAPDIIFCHNLQFGDTGVVVNYIKKHPNVKLYADNHADYVNSARNRLSKYIKHKILWKYYIKKIEPFLSKVYGVTPVRCRFLEEMYHINPSLIDFLPIGVDDDAIPKDKNSIKKKIREELSIGDDQVIMMTGGKIELRKNIHLLFEAFERINDNNLHLVVCGTFKPEVSFLEKKMKNNKNIHLLGWCSQERIMNTMVASDFACFPGTHSTLWEQSIGLGMPAIFKYWEGMDHVNINGNCIFIKEDNVDEIVKAIEMMQKKESYIRFKKLAEEASSFFLYSEIARKAIGM